MSNYGSGVNKYRTTAGFIRRIFMVAQGRNSLGASLCLGEMETISKLVQSTYEWGPKQKDYNDAGRKNYSGYIMHTLLFALRPMDAKAIIDKMSPDNKKLLTEAIVASQLCPKPKLSEVRTEGEACARRIKRNEFNPKTNEKDVLPCIRNIDECAEFVAADERWWFAQEEMHKWSDILGVPYDDAMIETNDLIKKKKNIESHEAPIPEQNTVVVPAETEPVEIKPITPELVQTDKEKTEPQQKPRRGRPKGSKNKPRVKVEPVAESPIPGQKLRKISETEQEPGMPKQKDILYTADGRELWSLGKLALALGMADEKTFSRKKSNFLYRHKNDKDYKELEESIQKWFEKRGTYVYFRAENIEKLKKLFGPTVTKHRAKKVEEPVAENPVEMPVTVVPTEPAPVVEEQVAHVEPVVDEKPTDMVAVKGTDVYLTKLMGLYEAANAEQQRQKGLSEEYTAKAQTAKTNKEQAERDAREIQASMKEYQEIQGDLALAEEGLRVATERLKEQQDRLSKWMTQNKKYLEK